MNMLSDIVVMTGAVYFTGGALSPLFPIYVIEVAVLALLSNLGVTLLGAAAVISGYGAMVLAVHLGWVPSHPPPAAGAADLSPGQLVVLLCFAGFVIAVPTFYSSLVLRMLRRRERELERRTAELVEAGKQKTLFMANVTHELRTPIHGIVGLSQVIEAGIYGPLTARQQDAHQGIQGSARSLLRLVDDLLELARAESGKLSVQRGRVDLTELLDGATAAARWMIGAKQLTLESAIASDLPIIESDRGKLSHVIVNLLSNAIKFTPAGGHVFVRAARQGATHVAISVEDTGPGIPTERQAAMWEEFRQLDDRPERDYGGVGLGLAIVRRLTHAVGGTIDVDSEPGRGSRFTVVLPTALPAEVSSVERGETKSAASAPADPVPDAALADVSVDSGGCPS